MCADLVNFPQDLTLYAEKAGKNKRLLSPDEQAGQAARQKRMFYLPWRTVKSSKSVKEGLQNNFYLSCEKGFCENLRPYSPEAWAELVGNARPSAYPTRSEHAITVANTSLRAMPTDKPFFLNPDNHGEGFPFDYFQHTAVWVGTPLYLSHTSADGQWVLAETPFASGWVPVEDVAVVDDDFKARWMEGPLTAILRDGVLVRDLSRRDKAAASNPSIYAHIGTLLPLKDGAGSLTVLVPVRRPDGSAHMAEASLPPGTAAVVPLPVTPGAVAKIGNEMMGQPYGWGGLFENRDCSALVRDILTPFGIWLPRNSSGQATNGLIIDLADLTPDEKEERVKASGIPFLSLLWLKGHICLYIGTWNDTPVMYHNIWGLRVKVRDADGTERTGRAVIGKACVTTLRPGAELPEISSPASLLDRIERLVLLPKPLETK